MLRLTARAKINWTLDIVGRRADGYHQMDMLMQSVALADTLTVAPADGLTLTIEGAPGLPVENNLVLKAARLTREATGCRRGAAFALRKRIPSGAGMGGGSADAAAALLALNRLWALRLSEDELAALALRCGADVPFLVRGGFARVGGIGEKLRLLPEPPSVPLIVFQPCDGLSTKEVFSDFDALAPTSVVHPQTDLVRDALLSGDLRALSGRAGNVLQAVSQQKRPAIAEAIAALTKAGARFAQMTGSGSAVFGAFEREAEADAVFSALRARWPKAWRTRTATKSVTID